MKKYFAVILAIVLVSILAATVSAQGKAGRRNINSNNSQTKPCNQLSGEDLLVKSHRCTLPGRQVTTVGAYQQSLSKPNASKGGNPTVNSTFNQMETLSSNVRGSKPNPGKRAKNNADPNNQTTANPGGAATSARQPRPRGGRRTGKNAPGNTNGEANPPTQTNETASQGKTNNTGLQETRYDFPYPNQPSDIVTWNENSGPYGYTTANQGWEFIQTNAGIAVRRRGQEGTVVAHTKCNDTSNYTFGYGGNGGSISMIMCRPKTEGLPRLRPSIMIVPKGQ